jgi:intracellular septation protein
MKSLLDMLPVIVFFVAYYQSDLFGATAAVMVACGLQTFGYRLFAGKFDRNHLMALVLVLPFGGLTLLLRDPNFIKWNGTVELWLLAAALIGSRYVGKKKPLLERMMGVIELPKKRWEQLNTAWASFLFVQGVCNIVVAYGFEEKTWVNFRLFGMTGMSLAFVGAQMYWILKWVREMDDELAAKEEASGTENPPPSEP